MKTSKKALPSRPPVCGIVRGHVCALLLLAPLTVSAGVRLVNARDASAPLSLTDARTLEQAVEAAAAGASDPAEAAADAVLAQYAAAGWPVTAVEAVEEMPGEITVKITEGVIGEAQVSGGRDGQRRAVSRTWSELSGKPLTLSRINAALDWIHRNPLHAATAGFTPGVEEASADAVLTLQSDEVLRLHTGWRNDGIAPLKRNRFTAGFELADAGGLPFWLYAEAQTSEDGADYLSARSTLRLFLPAHNEVRLSGGWTRVEADGIVPGFTSSSSLDLAWGSLRWLRPLPGVGAWQIDAGLGADVFRTASEVAVDSLRASGQADAVHLAAEVSALRIDGPDTSGLRLEAAFSPGGWTGDAGDEEHSALRSGASADYFLLRAQGWTRHEFASGSSLTLQGGGQWASEPVLPVQEFSPAGANAVRGFQEAAVLGDSGAWGGVEFALPEWRLLTNSLALQPLAFIEAGWARDAVAGRDETLAGAGAGLRVRLARHASLACDWGFRLTEPGSRVHLALQMEF